jgi:hypothetical protein
MAKGLCQESLQERAQDAFEDKLDRAGFRTQERIDWEAEGFDFPDFVEDLPPNGITFILAANQRWLKDFDDMQFQFLKTDKDNVKYLGLFWCSAARQLTIFDCRNYQGGFHAYSDFAKRI